jgi:hypothetical protein
MFSHDSIVDCPLPTEIFVESSNKQLEHRVTCFYRAIIIVYSLDVEPATNDRSLSSLHSAEIQ